MLISVGALVNWLSKKNILLTSFFCQIIRLKLSTQNKQNKDKPIYFKLIKIKNLIDKPGQTLG
jgi:hypothetical protein